MVSGQREVEPIGDRRRARHDATVSLIVAEAWRQAEQVGLAGLSVGELARAMEMRPQSLYSYFTSKHALYDHMYREGFSELRVRFEQLDRGGRPSTKAQAPKFLAEAAAAFVDFAAERPSRYQLLFQRTVPGFEPSPASYAVAVEVLERMRTWLQRAGISSEGDLDLWRALLLGLAGEQLANDPGGRRWRSLSERAARYFFTFTHTKGRPQ